MALLHATAQGRLFSLGLFHRGHALALGAGIAPVPSSPCPAKECDHHGDAGSGVEWCHESISRSTQSSA